MTQGKEVMVKQPFSLQREEGVDFGSNLHDVIYEWSLDKGSRMQASDMT